MIPTCQHDASAPKEATRCRHGRCGKPAPDYRLVALMGHRSWPVCAECARELVALGGIVIPVSLPIPGGALDSPLELPAGGRTVPAAGHPPG